MRALRTNLSKSVLAWIALLFFLGSQTLAQPLLVDAGHELHKAYQASSKKNKKAQAYLDLARIFESLRQHELAVDFYTQAEHEARAMPRRGEPIVVAASRGHQIAAEAWLRSLEGPASLLEMTADIGTKYYAEPTPRSGKPFGYKLSDPTYLTVSEFRAGYCRVVVHQGSVIKDGWFKLDTVRQFRFSPSNVATAEEKFRRYEYFVDKLPGFGDQALIKERMDELLFEHAKIANTMGTYRGYLSRFPEGVHREDVLLLIEASVYHEAESSNDQESYESYLATYPDGVHREDALQAIEDLVFAECQTEALCNSYLKEYPEGRHVAAAIEKIDAYRFSDVKGTESIERLQHFIHRFPQSGHLKAAQEEIVRLTFVQYQETSTVRGFREFAQIYAGSRYAAEAMRLADGIEFEPFRSRDTIEGYLDFLGQYPESHYRSEAEERIETLQYEPYTRRNTIQGYRDFLTLFPESRYSDEARRAIARLDTERVQGEVRKINNESRSLGNKYNVTFRGFSNGTLTVRIPALSTGGQLLRLFVGGVQDVEEAHRQYNAWKRSVVSRLESIRGVHRVHVVE